MMVYNLPFKNSFRYVNKNTLTKDQLLKSFIISSDSEGNKLKAINYTDFLLVYYEEKPKVKVFYFKNVDLETDYTNYIKITLSEKNKNKFKRNSKILNYNKKVFNSFIRIFGGKQ